VTQPAIPLVRRLSADSQCFADLRPGGAGGHGGCYRQLSLRLHLGDTPSQRLDLLQRGTASHTYKPTLIQPVFQLWLIEPSVDRIAFRL